MPIPAIVHCIIGGSPSFRDAPVGADPESSVLVWIPGSRFARPGMMALVLD
jgi:hypothetical protein